MSRRKGLSNSASASPSPSTPSKPSSRFKLRTVDFLRDHAVFVVPDPDSADKGAAAKPLAPHDREREWELDTLRLFKHRTLLITTAAMLSLPFFWLVFSSYAPDARWPIAAAHLLMFCCCGALNMAARRIGRLRLLRVVAMCAYIVYGMTASAVMVSAHNLNVVIFSGHEHILVSLLFVPFALPEAIFCTLMVVGTYAVGLSLSLSEQLSYTTGARISALVFLGTLIVLMNQMQALVRRRAFDLSFDLALSASRGAALSNLDAVTGGFNRRHLFNMLELELARAARFEQPLGVVMFDLDNFKAVNDTNGHLAGDEVLRTVLDAATQTLRGIDTIARYGGDEFVIALPNTNAHETSQTAERVREQVLESLQNRFESNSLESRVTLSLGAIAFPSPQSLSVEEIIERADAQLYGAKRTGKNRVCAQ